MHTAIVRRACDAGCDACAVVRASLAGGADADSHVRTRAPGGLEWSWAVVVAAMAPSAVKSLKKQIGVTKIRAVAG